MRPGNADTAKERVLRALIHRPHTAVELSSPAIGGLRYSARIKELRDEGINIVGEALQGKSYLLYSIKKRKDYTSVQCDIPF